MNGHKMVGEVTGLSQGRPAVLEWHYAAAPEKKFGFTLEYKYDVNLGLSYFPSEIRMLTGNRELICIYKILILETSATPLAKDYFDPMRYFGGSSSPIVTFSNNASYYMSDGHLEKVRPLVENPLEKARVIKTYHAKLAKLFIWGFVVLLQSLCLLSGSAQGNEVTVDFNNAAAVSRRYIQGNVSSVH